LVRPATDSKAERDQDSPAGRLAGTTG